MADDDFNFEFEAHLEKKQLPAAPASVDQRVLVAVPPQELIGQQPGNYRKNFKKTVCTYWLRGMCMKGDACGFLHQYDVDKMPICRNLLKFGECKDIDCPYKHDTEEIKECNMYRLGFCIYGPQCRFKHRPLPGPPPAVENVEAAKPKEVRDTTRVVNSVNPGVIEERDRSLRMRRAGDAGLGAGSWGEQDNKRPRALTWGTGGPGGGGAGPQPPQLPPPPQQGGAWMGPGGPPPAAPGAGGVLPPMGEPRPAVPGPRPPPNPPPAHLQQPQQQQDGKPQPPQQLPPSDGQQQQQQGGGEHQGPGSQQHQQQQQGRLPPPGLMPSITPPGGGGPGVQGGGPGAGPMAMAGPGGPMPGFMGPPGMPGLMPPGMPGMMPGMAGAMLGAMGPGGMIPPAMLMNMMGQGMMGMPPPGGF